MRALLRSMRPDCFEDISAVLALYRPGPDGRQRPQRLRRPQERPQAGRCRSTRSWPSRWPRSSATTYGLIVYQEQVMAIAQKLAGYSLGARRPAAPGDGQEEEGDPRRGVRAVLRRHEGERLLRPRDQDAVGHPASRSPTTRSTRRTPPATGWSSYWTAYLKANYPAEYMAALLTSVATTRTSRRSTSPSAGGWASRCCRRTSTSPTPTSPRSAPTSGSG